LSNWFPAPFSAPAHSIVSTTTDAVHRFCNSEQYMMYNKALLFGDGAAAAETLAVPDGQPKLCQAIGRRVQGFDKQVWEANALAIVSTGLFHKYSQNPEFAAVLLATGEQPIVEANKHDSVWGIGLDVEAARATPPTEWPGTNFCGVCLMRVRERLRAGERAEY
jgi:ribA/ribD-fused uncharacterized protein